MLQLFLLKSKAIFATWTKNRNEQNKNRNNQEEYIPPRVPLSFLHLTTFPVCIHSDVEPSELVFSLEQLEHSLQPHGLCPQTAVSPLQADKAGQDPSLQHSQSALLSSKGIVKSKQIYYHLKCQQRLKKMLLCGLPFALDTTGHTWVSDSPDDFNRHTCEKTQLPYVSSASCVLKFASEHQLKSQLWLIPENFPHCFNSGLSSWEVWGPGCSGPVYLHGWGRLSPSALAGLSKTKTGVK